MECKIAIYNFHYSYRRQKPLSMRADEPFPNYAPEDHLHNYISWQHEGAQLFRHSCIHSRLAPVHQQTI